MKKYFWRFLATIGVTILLVWAWVDRLEPFESYSLRFNDSYYMLQEKQPHEDVLFIAVDEPSVNRFGRWPWDRSIIAQGLEHLVEADVVIMDMIFSEPTSEDQDGQLRDSLASLNNSVCGFFLRHKATQNISELQEELLIDSALDRLMVQVQENGYRPNFIGTPFLEMNTEMILEGCSMSGAFSTLRDTDQLLRSYPIAYFIKSANSEVESAHLYPSLGVQGMRLRLNSDIERIDDEHLSLGDQVLKVDHKGFMKLNYYALADYKTLSFADVMDSKYPDDYFKNKIVILGVTDVGAGDMRATPIGEIPGPLLHYTFFSNVLGGDLLHESRELGLAGVVFFALLPFAGMLLFASVSRRAALYIGLYVAYYMLIRWMFTDRGVYIDGFYPLISILLSGVVLEIIAFIQQEQSSKFVRGAFSNYVSGELLNQLMEHPESLELGGEKKELSILFSDIRGFTTLSENMASPQDLLAVLNRYFTPMTNAVMDERGMVDKYIGDAVMAFFNAPVSIDHHAEAACKSALKMIHELENLNAEFAAENIPGIAIGIGINTDEVVVGNMGSLTRKNYTVIGDGVNLASRVEGLTKNYGVQILITEFTEAQLGEEFLRRQIEPVKVKGKEEAVLLYELMVDTPEHRELKGKYDEALVMYQAGGMSEAREKFATLSESYDDSVSRHFINDIDQGEAWGVKTMKTK
jgi:adenylate cyclase